MDRGINLPTISILGCGWLGLPLAEKLIASGYTVKGSTTTAEKLIELKKSRIEAYEIRMGIEQVEGDIQHFLQSEILILNIPPGRRNPNVNTEFPQKIALLLSHIKESSIKKILFVSSTSVYGETKGTITQYTPLSPSTSSGEALVKTESLLMASNLQTSVLRPGGLVGGNRHPGRFLAGRTNIKNGDAPINLIHRDDVISIILSIIQQNQWGIALNASSDRHPSKQSYYTFAAEKLELEQPTFLPGGEDEKLISNQALKQTLGYQFIYADPFQMI